MSFSRSLTNNLRQISSRRSCLASTSSLPQSWRISSRSLVTGAEASSSSSSSTPPPASSSSSSSSSDPKLSAIVDSIEKLTLLEAADLVGQLKTRLNIQDIAMPSASSSAPAAAAPAAAPAEEEKPKEKTVFTLKLKALKDPSAKAKVIREVKALNSTMNLVEAKKFVESAPQVLKEGLSKEDADKLQKTIEDAGGVVELE